MTSVPAIEALVDRVLARDARAVARAISSIENAEPQAAALLEHLRPHTGTALLVGVTGPAGAGKSTLINQLVARQRAGGRRVGVLAVDPTSPFTGGAVLGDRVRLQAHAGDDDVFVRSMATRGDLGGLAAATGAAAAVLDAAGFDPILIETVGVGQDEIAVAGTADLVIVLQVPGTGDDVQALKSGLLEIADIFVVNKSDREGAAAVVASLEALTVAGEDAAGGGWRPPVLSVNALDGSGVDALVDAIERFRALAGKRDRSRRRPVGRGHRESAGQEVAVEPAREVLVLDHIGVAVQDVRALAGTLERTFGVVAGPLEEVADHHVRVQFIGSGAGRIEMLEPIGPQSSLSAFLDGRPARLHHVALAVDDLEAELARLARLGVRLIDAVPRQGAGGSRVAFVHPTSTGGVLFELVERPPADRLPARPGARAHDVR